MEPDDIALDLPEGLGDEQLLKFIQDHVKELSGALDLTVYDDRATVDEIEIDKVQIDGDEITVQYHYSWSSYSGCRDMQSGDTEYEAISGVREGNVVYFPRFEEPQRQAPNEEL